MAYWLWSVPPEHYPVYAKTGTFAVRRVGKQAMQSIRPGDRIFAYLSGSRMIAGLFEATGAAFEDHTALVRSGAYPHRVRVRALAELNEEARVPYEAFAGKLRVLGEYEGDPDRQFRAVAQRVVHRLPEIDGRLLEFLVDARLGTDFESLAASLDRWRRERAGTSDGAALPTVREEREGYAPPPSAWDRSTALDSLIEAIEARGFVYQPWHIAAYVTALRTKPFVILAGVTGVGKSKLPVLVAESTGGHVDLIPVKPDWTDSADVLGYEDLQGRFRAGALLHAAYEASNSPQHHAVVLDEMNLARPEHYLAEVLSRIEGRRATAGGWATEPLAPRAKAPWNSVALPPNLALVGTVNMDESAYGFSRKVLDRAFTLELGDPDLGHWRRAEREGDASVAPWPAAAWRPRALTPGGVSDLARSERKTMDETVGAISDAHALLAPVGFGIGYRTRDEAALFTLHAAETPEAFHTREGETVDPLDLALTMKLLPRLAGGAQNVRRAVFGLLGWALGNAPIRSEDDARTATEAWDRAGRPATLPDARYPRTAARLALMADRLMSDGFASYWD